MTGLFEANLSRVLRRPVSISKQQFRANSTQRLSDLHLGTKLSAFRLDANLPDDKLEDGNGEMPCV